MTTKPINPRTARTPGQGEQHYIIANGAPEHYVSGYGQVRGGHVVTLPKNQEPSRWFGKISPDQAAEAQADPAVAAKLAAKAAENVKPEPRRQLGTVAAPAAGDAESKKAVANAEARAKAAEQEKADAEKRAADAEARAAELAEKLANAEAAAAKDGKSDKPAETGSGSGK